MSGRPDACLAVSGPNRSRYRREQTPRAKEVYRAEFGLATALGQSASIRAHRSEAAPGTPEAYPNSDHGQGPASTHVLGPTAHHRFCMAASAPSLSLRCPFSRGTAAFGRRAFLHLAGGQKIPNIWTWPLEIRTADAINGIVSRRKTSSSRPSDGPLQHGLQSLRRQVDSFLAGPGFANPPIRECHMWSRDYGMKLGNIAYESGSPERLTSRHRNRWQRSVTLDGEL